MNTLKVSSLSKDKANRAKLLLESCSSEELDLLHTIANEWDVLTYRNVFVVAIWSSKKKRVEISNSWEECKRKVSNMGPGYATMGIATIAAYAKGSWKGVILNTSFFLPMSWPFEALPLAVGGYVGVADEILKWRLQIGR